MKYCLLLGTLGLALPVWAQPATVQVSTPTTTNVYARERIDLLEGFETSTDGFEALIKLPEASAGRWSAPLRWTDFRRGGSFTPITGMVGIHTHVLPNGKVLSWEGHNNDDYAFNQDHQSHAYVWDPNPNGLNDPSRYEHHDLGIGETNIFCAGHAFLADGRLLVTGGHYSGGLIDRANTNVNNPSHHDYIPPGFGDVDGYIGLRDANVFDFAAPVLNKWQTLTPMRYRRWYPTNTTLADGRVLVVAGQRYGGATANDPDIQAEEPEIYDPATGWQPPLSTARRGLPLYPWMFLAPDGRVFNAGPNPDTGFINPNTGPGATTINGTAPGTWTNGPNRQNWRGAGTAVMYRPGEILVLGGQDWGDPVRDKTIHRSTELISLNAAAPTFRNGPDMVFARHHADATLLADGTVLVTGGGQVANNSTDAPGVLNAELWTPPSASQPGGMGSWATLNPMTTPRLYHSAALLLPDATVLALGGGQGGGFNDHPDYEIFTPPYLCRGLSRPQITTAPLSVAYGQSYRIATPDPYAIARVTWVRLSSVTHSLNMNQRFLEFTPSLDPFTDALALTAPTSPNDCPPGHYMVFLIDHNGTPSQAHILSINHNTCTAAPSFTYGPTLLAADKCSGKLLLSVDATAPNANMSTNYRWSIDGVHQPQADGRPTLEVPVSVYKPEPKIKFEVTPSCGGSAFVTEFLVKKQYFKDCSFQVEQTANK